jgi:hypothetical protein
MTGAVKAWSGATGSGLASTAARAGVQIDPRALTDHAVAFAVTAEVRFRGAAVIVLVAPTRKCGHGDTKQCGSHINKSRSAGAAAISIIAKSYLILRALPHASYSFGAALDAGKSMGKLENTERTSGLVFAHGAWYSKRPILAARIRFERCFGPE